MAVETLKAEVILGEGVKVDCLSRGFGFPMDQAKEAGGNNEGMCPGEALLSALGGCKCMIVRKMSEASGINLKSLKLELEGEIDPEGPKTGFTKIITKYSIQSDNTEKEVKDFIEKVENNCPVKDTIVNAPSMNYEVSIQQ
ncbi:MAG: peroxiredoxin [Lachnospiraceae bacterium]|jgi:uncharacterized OsmC-like protein|nr:peroxiredoxin [Lachnospiraceae bacterium]